ncbi:unnamed protein product [Tuber aestivum]|uniref:Uncharacterized protein n=1 Tax=Tuber aestivum TaxID=59557 RepID=A0A292PME2_9PEZI|nr:unnamed protein product [Tuber aestivum]
MADAWESIPSSMIFNCWKKSGLLPYGSNLSEVLDIPTEDPSSNSRKDNFLSTTTASMQITLRKLYPDSNTTEFQKICDDFLGDNNNLEGLAIDCSEIGIPDASQLVEEQVHLGLLTYGIHDMEVSYLDAAGDSDENQDSDPVSPSTLLTHSEAIEYLYHLSRYLQSLPIDTLPTPAGRKITQSTMVEKTTYLATTIGIFSYQESLKKQTKIDHYFTWLPSHPTIYGDTNLPATAYTRTLSVKGKEKGREQLKVDQKGKGKEVLFSGPGLDEEETAGSETADEEEGSFEGLQPGPCIYPYPDDSQDLNLYPSQYDHNSGRFSQVYRNLLL